MNDESKAVGDLEKKLLSAKRGPRTPLKVRQPRREATAQEAAERAHADFPKTIKYLGQ